MYVAYTEGMNFKKALADLLGLEADASVGACLQRIRQLLDRPALLSNACTHLPSCLMLLPQCSVTQEVAMR